MGPTSPVGNKATCAKLTETIEELKIAGNPLKKLKRRGPRELTTQLPITQSVIVTLRAIFMQHFSWCFSVGGGIRVQRDAPIYTHAAITRMEYNQTGTNSLLNKTSRPPRTNADTNQANNDPMTVNINAKILGTLFFSHMEGISFHSGRKQMFVANTPTM